MKPRLKRWVFKGAGTDSVYGPSDFFGLIADGQEVLKGVRMVQSQTKRASLMFRRKSSSIYLRSMLPWKDTGAKQCRTAMPRTMNKDWDWGKEADVVVCVNEFGCASM